MMMSSNPRPAVAFAPSGDALQHVGSEPDGHERVSARGWATFLFRFTRINGSVIPKKDVGGNPPATAGTCATAPSSAPDPMGPEARPNWLAGPLRRRPPSRQEGPAG